MLKAIHAQEDKAAALEKAELRTMKLKKVADKLLEGIDETLTYMDFPEEYWRSTNNAIDRPNREMMLVCVRFCHVVSTQWSAKNIWI